MSNKSPRLSAKETKNIIKKAAIKNRIKQVLEVRDEVLFAYIHGSILYSDNPKDIDLAVFLNPKKYDELAHNGEQSIGFAIPLEIEMEMHLNQKVDLQILNKAPLSFRHSVITHGDVIIDKDSGLRCDFEYLSRVEYFDFRPKRELYLREVMT